MEFLRALISNQLKAFLIFCHMPTVSTFISGVTGGFTEGCPAKMVNLSFMIAFASSEICVSNFTYSS